MEYCLRNIIIIINIPACQSYHSSKRLQRNTIFTPYICHSNLAEWIEIKNIVMHKDAFYPMIVHSFLRTCVGVGNLNTCCHSFHFYVWFRNGLQCMVLNCIETITVVHKVISKAAIMAKRFDLWKLMIRLRSNASAKSLNVRHLQQFLHPALMASNDIFGAQRMIHF